MPSADRRGFDRDGWLRLPATTESAAWAAAARAEAEATLKTMPADQWRSGGTWAVGRDLLTNRPTGQLSGGETLPDGWRRLTAELAGLQGLVLHAAQVSTVLRGYPRPSPGEGAAAFRFRRDRAAAHLDGLVPTGPGRVRRLAEPHAIVFGIGLSPGPGAAGALTVWRGSHRILGPALRDALAGLSDGDIPTRGLSGPYQAARRRALQACDRVALPLNPGEGVILHRHSLHGIAPWPARVPGPALGRQVAYFRPTYASLAQWRDAP